MKNSSASCLLKEIDYFNIYKCWKNINILQLWKSAIPLRCDRKASSKWVQTVLFWSCDSDDYGDNHYSTGFTSFFYNVFSYGFRCLSYKTIRIKDTMDRIFQHDIFFNNLVHLRLFLFLYLKFFYIKSNISYLY